MGAVLCRLSVLSLQGPFRRALKGARSSQPSYGLLVLWGYDSLRLQSPTRLGDQLWVLYAELVVFCVFHRYLASFIGALPRLTRAVRRWHFLGWPLFSRHLGEMAGPISRLVSVINYGPFKFLQI